MTKKITRISAVGVIINDEDKILLCRLSKIVVGSAGKWILPGGGLDHSEHPEAAVVREVKEETGLNAKVEKLLGIHSEVIDYPDWNGLGAQKNHAIRIIYKVSVEPGELKTEQGGSTDACAWFSKDEVVKLELVNLTVKALEYYL